jgi:type I restriction enzyme S subunit
MTNWKEYKLGEIALKITKGTTPSSIGKRFTDKGVNYIKSEAVGYDGIIDTSTFVYIDEETHEKLKRSQLEESDILFSMAGAYLGKTGMVKSYMLPANTNQALALIRLNQNIANPSFILYYLRQNNVVQYVNSMSSQSAQPNVNLNEIGSLIIPLPDLPTQTAIAEILSSLDDKIELNNKINQELENLAQTLFKQWFIDFEFPNQNGEPYKSSGGEMVDSELGEIPKGWEVKRVDELNLYISDLVANGSFASIKENVQTAEIEDYALFIRNTDLKNRFKTQKLFVNKHSYNFLKKTELSGGEIILPNVGDVGSVHRCPKFDIPMTLGNNCIMVKSDYLQNWLFTFFRSSVGFHSLRSVVVGSVQDKLSKTNFKSIKIVVPDSETQKLTENALMSIYDLQESNLKESDEFEILRDTLLPKLISGELEVNGQN